jgi:predicted Holliday junction resolvase-like endonuclease
MLIVFIFLLLICLVIVIVNYKPETELQKIQRKYNLSNSTLDEIIYKHNKLKERFNSKISLEDFIKLILKEDGKRSR